VSNLYQVSLLIMSTIVLVVVGLLLRDRVRETSSRSVERLLEEVAEISRSITRWVGEPWQLNGSKENQFGFRLPSLTRGFLKLAAKRLPAELSKSERDRWEREMKADVASLPRWRRLFTAFNAWRKGAPNIPTARESAPRSIRD
jgi:hypothetical protein